MLRQFKNQLLIDVTPEGLRIQIIDEKNRPMFDTSSAELKPYSKVILREIGKALNAVPNKVSFSGHTDAAQFGGLGRHPRLGQGGGAEGHHGDQQGSPGGAGDLLQGAQAGRAVAIERGRQGVGRRGEAGGEHE